jgi:GWxTD domain-containing protein
MWNRTSTLVVVFSLLAVVLTAQDSRRPLAEDWFDDDEWHLTVRSIITKRETLAYRLLKTERERDDFIVGFWARRDPTPGIPGNEFRDEFERRVDHAKASFREPDSPRSGLDTDRGRIFVMFGQPSDIRRFPTGAYEIWRYAEAGDGGSAFSFQFAVPPIHSYDGGYRILSPLPTASIKGALTSVQVYPRGFVTAWIPMDFSTVTSVAHELQTSAGERVPDDEAEMLNGRLGPAGNDPLSRHLWAGRTFETGGMGFTQPLPPGSYVFSTTLTFTSGDIRSDHVAFEVK